MTDGALVIDKPAGMTSHDVVDEIRKRLRTKRVGHGGTLDPDATGVLLIGVGKATRFLSYAQASPKRYLATVRLGITTASQDASGEVVEERPVNVTAEQVEAELKTFVGEIQQIPPMVSAVRIGGERLHVKARRGEEVDRPPRTVTIHELRMISERIEEASELTLDVTCSGGTYIRTLAHDLGALLGCGAHLVSLRRTEAAGFKVEDAIALEDAGAETLLPLVEVVHELPRTEVDETTAALVSNGRPLIVEHSIPPDACTAVVHGDRLLGVYRSEGLRLVAERVVPV